MNLQQKLLAAFLILTILIEYCVLSSYVCYNGCIATLERAHTQGDEEHGLQETHH